MLSLMSWEEFNQLMNLMVVLQKIWIVGEEMKKGKKSDLKIILNFEWMT
jgi:hypothetical protein